MKKICMKIEKIQQFSQMSCVIRVKIFLIQTIKLWPWKKIRIFGDELRFFRRLGVAQEMDSNFSMLGAM